MAFTTSVDITDSIVFTVFGNVISSLVPSTVGVVRAQQNRVPPPNSSDFILMTPTHRDLLEIPVVSWDHTNPNPTTINLSSHVKLTIQLDIFGPNSADNAIIIATIFRSGQGYDLFAQATPAVLAGAVIEPLYTEQPRQIPFETAAQQYTDRWIVEALIQANINVTLSQDYADALYVGIVNVDAVYPP